MEYRPYSYQYETSPRKLQPEYDLPRKNNKAKINNSKQKNTGIKNKQQNNKKSKKIVKTKYNYKPVAYIILTFIMLFTISYRYSLINEKYNQKENIKSQVSAVQKENEQLKVSIENSLNLNSVEKAAEEKLGMKKLDNSQKVYLDLQKKDYVEPASEKVVIDDNSSWFQKLIKKLTEVIK